MIGRIVLAALAVAFAGVAPASAQSSWGIGVLPNGTIVFCDPGRGTIWRVEPNGARAAVATGVTCRAVVTSVDGNVDGEAIPGDVTAARGVGLWRIDATGAKNWLMPLTPAPEPGMWLVRDRQGQVFSWNGAGVGSPRSEIVVRDTIGLTSVVAGAEWGQQDGDGRSAHFGNVEGLAVAPDGSLLIADSGNIRRMSGLHTVRTEARGVISDSRLGLTNAPGLWGRELGIAADTTGAAVVVDPEAGRVVHVDRGGRATPIWESAGFAQRVSGGRWGWRPTGVAMLGTTYYVLDDWMGPALIADIVGSPRLSHVDANGRVTRVASVSSWTVRAAAVTLLLIALSVIWVQIRSRRRA